MKFVKAISTFLLLAVFFHLSASAQNDVLNQIMMKTAKANADVPLEKVYLHFDKPYYAVGDTIWFKAYVTFDHHLLSPISKVVDIDIISPHDSLVQEVKLPVKNGVAWGNIVLSQFSFRKGNYRVVAYTNYMNNNGFTYFFNKNITLGDAVNNQVSAQVSLKSSLVGKLTKVTAGIYYKDDDGSPYHDKKVSWDVQKDDQSIAKGKGVTDKNGFIDISFINLKNVKLDSAVLVAQVDNGQHKVASNSFPLKTAVVPNDFQFFPEGGQLIVGVRTKIAFKATKADGLGIDVKGTITDNNNNLVTEFASSHLGMGVFVLAPEDGKTYTAHVTFGDGTTAIPVLPKVGADGIDLSLDNNDPDNLNLKLQADQAFLNDFKGKTFFILGKSSGTICFAAKMALQDLVYNASIPKNKFPTGIAQITLFTDDGEPVSERIAFIEHNDELKLSVGSQYPSYNTREMVKLNITAKNGPEPAEGNFSVSVISESKVPVDENSETTILTNLLLTSDIKGYIEQPNYYFNHPDQKAMADLDVLLQTQGYRRFTYDEILNNKFPVIRFIPEKGIEISGTLRGSSGIPVNRGNVHISIPDKNFFANAVTDADGHFAFSNLMFADSAKVVISARDNVKASDLVLTLDQNSRQNFPVNYDEADEVSNIDSVLSTYLKNSKMQYSSLHMIKQVEVKSTRIVKTIDHTSYSSLASLGALADHVIKASQLEGCNNLLDCLKGQTMGMIYDNDNFYVFRDYTQGKKVPVALFVRGVLVDINYLQTITPSSVESVEVFTKDELGMVNSTYNTNGAIVINLRTIETTKISYQDLKQIMGSRNEITFSPKGYQPVKTFYLPRYTGPRNTQHIENDLRSTIYWNPNLTTDKTGSATVEFFNADGQGPYKVTIEGIDKDGNIGRQVYRYTVK